MSSSTVIAFAGVAERTYPMLTTLLSTSPASNLPRDNFPSSKGAKAFLSNEGTLDQLRSRQEFRKILSSVVHTTRESLDRPGITPFTPEEVFRWFQQISLEDVQAAFNEFKAAGDD